ncbi:hypothetical protein AMTRI_Chr04g190740 [Amborella trichopoda]
MNTGKSLLAHSRSLLVYRGGMKVERLKGGRRGGGVAVRMQQQQQKPSTYCSSLATDLPLYESPLAPFEEYLEQRERVFEAIFPDKRRSLRLNHEEWRIQMLPIHFVFLTANPVVDMRLKCETDVNRYPPGVPSTIPKVLTLEAMRWELRGLDYVLKPDDFTLGVRGALYSEKQQENMNMKCSGTSSRLKGQLEISISFILPPVLALIPEDVRSGVADAVLKRLLMSTKDRVNGCLLSDFRDFTRDRLHQHQLQWQQR